MRKIYLNDDEEAVFVINGKEITVSKLTVSPTSAKDIIAKSDEIFTNRKSNKNSYSLYAKDIANGEWKTNGETIKFSKEGALIDGRNRLSAVSIGEKDVDFLTVGGIEKSVVDTIDIGLKRSLEHALKMQGFSYEKGSAAIVKLKLELDNRRMGCFTASDMTLKLSRLKAVHEYENFIDEYNNVALYGKDIFTTSHKALGVREVGGIYMHLTNTLNWDKEVVNEFFNKLATPTEKSIFFTTYDKLANKKVCRNRDRIKEYMICWNSYITGKRTIRCSYKEGDWFIEHKEGDEKQLQIRF